MRFPLLLPFILILISGIALASHSDSIDISSRPKLIGGIGTRNTFIYGFNAPIIHARIGAEWNKKLRIGAGFCWLKQADFKNGKDQTPFVYEKPVMNEYNQPDTVPSFLHLVYFSYFTEYVYYNKKKWELSIPVQLGFGQMYYEYNAAGVKSRELDQPVLLYEPSVSLQYRLFRWFALGADVGYRFMLVDKKLGSGGYNSPIYDLKFMILWGEIYKSVFPRGVFSKR